MRGHALAAFAVALALCPAVAEAQDAPPRVHSFDVTAGMVSIGGTDLGTSTASLTGNDPGGPGYPLFSTSTRVGNGTGFGARAGFSLTRVLSVEGTMSWVPETYTTHISGDVEGAPDTDATTRIDTYGVGAAVLLHVRRLTFGRGRGLPFVVAGMAYVRQLDDRGQAVATGQSVDAGGGVKYAFARRDRGFIRSLGARAEFGVTSRSGDFDPTGQDRRRTGWQAAAGVFVGF
jgi:hypothetical protein